MTDAGKHVEITYCTQCRWMLRAAWYTQEILSTFEGNVDSVTMRPGAGGVFEVFAGGSRIWSREHDGGFPDIAELKRRVRDAIAPGKDLGHIDRTRR